MTHWRLPTSNQSEDDFPVEKTPDWRIVPANDKPSSLQELNSNILLTCVLLEGVGHFAQVNLIGLCGHVVLVRVHILVFGVSCDLTHSPSDDFVRFSLFTLKMTPCSEKNSVLKGEGQGAIVSQHQQPIVLWHVWHHHFVIIVQTAMTLQ